MLTVEMTEHLLGYRIYGDYDALDKLYDAIFELSDVNDDTSLPEAEYNMRTRMLALCYDLRHAYQGDRGVKMIDNGMNEEMASWKGVEVSSYKNLIYYVEILYPEAMYEVIGLNWLIQQRWGKLLGKALSSSDRAEDPKVIFDPACAQARLYQSLVMEALRAKATPTTFSRIRKQVAEQYYTVGAMYTQWLDILNGEWTNMTVKQREKGLGTMVRDLTDYHGHFQYAEVVADIDRFAIELNTRRGDVPLKIYYAENCDW